MNKSDWQGLAKDGLFDRRFRARGFDKASFVYEAATLGYRFKVLHGAFLVHVADNTILTCPEIIFGSEFCSVASNTDHGDWYKQHESSRDVFAGFIQSLALFRASQGKGNIAMDRTPSECLIFPFSILRHLSIDFIHMWLDCAYQAHDQALADLHVELTSSVQDAEYLPQPDDDAFDRSITHDRHVGKRAKASDWMVSRHWSKFSASWCGSVPAVIGRVLSCNDSTTAHVDGRVLEANFIFSSQALSMRRYRHYVSAADRLFLLRRRSLQQREIELTANVRLYDICREVGMDEYSRIWQCPIHTLLEDIEANTSRQLYRESILVESGFHGDGVDPCSSNLDGKLSG